MTELYHRITDVELNQVQPHRVYKFAELVVPRLINMDRFERQNVIVSLEQMTLV